MIPTLADFIGRWRIERRIDDHRADQKGHFDGWATFSPRGDGLHYNEKGYLTLGAGPETVAERSYLWSDDSGRFVVSFPDGRFFHDFHPGAPVATHYCDPDHYSVTYDLTRWPFWSATWDVTGPRKHYRLVSSYAR